MKNIDPSELSYQLKKPSGELGHEVAQKLNESNRKLYELAWQMADFKSIQQVLEIGFGNGKHMSHYFEKKPDLTVTGVDFSEEMCGEARQSHRELIKDEKLIIHCADASAIPVSDDTYDLIVGLNIVYFLDPPAPYFKEIKRVLKPGGNLLLGYRPRCTVEHLEFTRQNFILYEPEELNELLSEHGLEVAHHEQNSYMKRAADHSMAEISDICLIAKRV